MFTIRLTTVFVSGLFLWIVGTLLRMQDLYYMSGTLILLPFVSYGIARLAMRKLNCTREVQQYAREGEPVQVTISLKGKGNLLGPVQVDEVLPDWIERTESTRTFIDPETGDLGITYSVVAHKRGVYDLGRLRLRITDPLGFFIFTTRYPLPSELVVMPQPLEVPDLHIEPGTAHSEFSSGAFDGRGARSTGLDFHGVREYQTGDDLKRVHWRSTARHGTLNVIEFEHSTVRDTVIALDLRDGTELGQGRYTTLEYAVKIAAQIAEHSLLSGSMVRLAGDGIPGMSMLPGSGPDQLYVILDALARVKADRNEPLSTVLLNEAEFIKRGSNVVCLVSSIDDDLQRCADILVSRGIGVRIMLLTMSESSSQRDPRIPAGIALGRTALTELGCSSASTDCQVRYEYSI